MASYPDFYHPARTGKFYTPDVAAATRAGQAIAVRPASEDDRRILLLLVDTQVDFIHEDGALAVPGAIADTRRTIEWLYRNVGHLTAIAASLDSHTPLQIFYPTWWIDAAGHHPDPYTAITSDDVRGGRWRPLVEPDWSAEYVRKLEEQARKTLMIWPYHTMIGTPGHAITPALYEAIAYHAAARQTQPEFLYKGFIPQTEHYSILEPEVKVPEHPMGGLNTGFLDMLITYDLIFIAGQAKSHCVLETVSSIMRYAREQPEIVRRLRLLIDCTSSVAHPTIDFEASAVREIARFEARGLTLARSTDSVV